MQFASLFTIKYLRAYPWWFQLVLFFLMMMIMANFASFLILVFLPKFTPYSLSQVMEINTQSPPSLVKAFLHVQFFSSIFSYLLPAFVFAYLAHPQPLKYLGLNAPGKWIQPILAMVLILSA